MMLQLVEKLYKNEEGQGLVEYALILALIAIVVIGAVQLIGTSAEEKFNKIGNAINDAGD